MKALDTPATSQTEWKENKTLSGSVMVNGDVESYKPTVSTKRVYQKNESHDDSFMWNGAVDPDVIQKILRARKEVSNIFHTRYSLEMPSATP